MADVVLFHHVQGLTEGVQSFAALLAAGGHAVYTPDLYAGNVFSSIEEGFAYAESVGAEEFAERTGRALAELPGTLVYAGISWGVATAQRLAQTRPGARGALLYEACIPITGDWAFGPWPAGVPVQIHGADGDPFFAGEGDIDAAREIVTILGDDLAQLYVYPGDQHLFTDSSLPSYDAAATGLAIERSIVMLDRFG